MSLLYFQKMRSLNFNFLSVIENERDASIDTIPLFYYTLKLDYTPYLYGNTSTKTVSFVRNLYDREKRKMTAIK